ncbi:HET-domain-containing protein, partial [Coniophora puteana RWD-64-598 SS2]
LCDTCIQIDLRRLLRNEDAHYQPIPLGNLAHITHKADPATANPEDGCSLCKLVIAAVDRAAFFLPEPITDRANVDAALYPLGSRLCVRLSHSPFGVFQGMGGAQIPCVPELRLVADDMHEWPASEMDGRPVRDLLDLELVKYWIHLCENEHGPECSVPWWAPAEELPVTVRLLDVQEMVLVPATRGRRYIALSYVWGDPKACAHDAYWTTSANLSSRTTKTRHKSKRKECKGEWEWSGGVPLDVLPPTITDTILLTRLLGERYLWVDALCILQDSPSDKAEQSSIMDAVLRRAFLTIIAAGGPDATAPLPGLRTGTRARASARQRSEEIHDLRLAVPLRTPYEALTGTPWNACARTYQELMLSPRRLLFTPEQVVFECGE